MNKLQNFDTNIFLEPGVWMLQVKLLEDETFYVSIRGQTIKMVNIEFNDYLPFDIDQLQGYKLVLNLRPTLLRFVTNSFFTEWYGVYELLKENTIDLVGPEGIDSNVNHHKLFQAHPNSLSIRFEVTFPVDNPHTPQLAVRMVPRSQTDMEKYDTEIDMASMPVSYIGLMAVQAIGLNSSDGTPFSIYPTYFTEEPVTMVHYKKKLESCLGHIKALIISHYDHDISSYKKAVKRGKTSNSYRFDTLVKSNKRKATSPVPESAPGIYKHSKFGANFDLTLYTNYIPLHLIDVISMALATTTWSSYRTGWKTFFDYLARIGAILEIPFPPERLVGFITYCSRTKSLAPSTVQNYLTGLKNLQDLHNVQSDNFQQPLVRIVKKGFANIHKCKLIPAIQRSVITWPILKIFREEVFNLEISHLDQQTIWTAALIGFWGSTRMGEILQGSYGFDKLRVLSWDRISEEDSSHIMIFLALPKVAKRELGEIVDLYNFPVLDMCPIYNLHVLHTMQAERREVLPSHPVFTLTNGKLLTMYKMNNILASTLDVCFPGIGHFTCHGFRSGLPSIMGAFPQYFDEQTIRDQGRWVSEACRVYTRIHGIGYKDVHKKLVSILLNARFYFYLNSIKGLD